ncbi:DUF6463 family protein [Deinococcus peraridilitoris]|uniref:Uncharacterized protein n=1 Tax=Deinococcus peraridilitoris (strain DSM 19664 / LMG 22246 / CIP 109416 / KR-200) TaxID=937777 RepID=L0A3J8_DEIPD|nr:DUF6463 family protein [Deinococcus peraridilitoris]AFZ67752.1 hypothetical protein Deipe_2271 [Deinococcus peraridilitoris DSM 19664]
MNALRDAGFWFRFLAVLHGAVGLAVYPGPLVDLLRAGLWNSVDGSTPRQAAFWFLMFAPMLYLIGLLATQARARTGVYPRALIGTVLAVCLIGTVLMPVSGFPLGLLVCVLARHHTDRRRSAGVRAP